VVRFFSGANPLNLLFLFFLGIVLRINTFTNPSIPFANESDGWLYKQLMEFLSGPGKKFPVLFPVLAYLLIYVQALVLNAYTNQRRVFPSLHLLTAFSVVFLSALVPEWGQWSPILLVNTILIRVWPKLTDLDHSEKVMSDVFNSGFAVGICSFIYFPAIFLYPLILLALLINRPFRFTEWFISLIGLALPYYFFFVFQYFFQHKLEPEVVFKPIHWKIPLAFSTNSRVWVQMAFLLVPLLTGFIYNRMAVTRMVVHTRKTWALNGFFLIATLLLIFMDGGLHSIVIVFLPAVLYVTSFYTFRKSKFFQELTVWLGIGWIAFQIFF
jgi:hypothetical protein